MEKEDLPEFKSRILCRCLKGGLWYPLFPQVMKNFDFTLEEARHFVKNCVSHYKYKIWTILGKLFVPDVAWTWCCNEHQISPKATSVVVRSHPSLQKCSCTQQLRKTNFFSNAYSGAKLKSVTGFYVMQ